MELILGKQFRLPIWEELLKSMCVNEVSRFVINRHLVINYPFISAQYRKFAKYPIECRIKQNSSCCARMIENGVGYDDLDQLMASPKDLIFIFEVLKAESSYSKEFWEMNETERRTEVLELKARGNEHYAKADYAEAERCYLKALSIVSNLLIKHAPRTDEYKELQGYEQSLNSNMAQVKFKQDNFYESIVYCDKVLKMDDRNVKMFYRRAQAKARVWNREEAEQDYERVVELDAKMERTVRKELDEMRKKLKEIEEDEAKRLSERLKSQMVSD